MKFLKKTHLTLSDWLSLVISLVFIISILLINTLNNRNLKDLQTSINTLSTPNETIGLLQNASRDLLVSENNFRIFLSTGDTSYRNRFLTHMNKTISQFELLQHSKDSLAVNQIISKLGTKIQLTDAINKLKGMADSVSNKVLAINRPNSTTGFKVEKINTSVFGKYVIHRMDTIRVNTNTTKEKKGFLQKLFTGKKDNVTTSVSTLKSSGTDSAGSELKNESSGSNIEDNGQSKKLDTLAGYIQNFYLKSFQRELDIRKQISDHEKKLAQTNLAIIDDIDNMLQEVLNTVKEQEKEKNIAAINSAVNANSAIKKQSWGAVAIILTAATILILSIVRIVRKAKELNKKNSILIRRNEINARLISIINHDIIAPLKFIKITSKNLSEKNHLIPEKLKSDSLNEVSVTSEQLELLATNILNWIKYQNENRHLIKEVINLHDLVNDVLGILVPLAKQNQVALVNEINPNQTVYQYIEPLKIILYNLILNAEKFSTKGKVCISSSEINNEIIISVKDEGVGMTEEQIKNIKNDQFIISSVNVDMKKGNGLGYLIIKNLLDIMDIKMKIESEKNKGTTILLLIPKISPNTQ